MAEPVLLISGIPGSGKSTFGRWLDETHSFLYVDMEAEGIDRHGLRPSWEQFLGDLSSRVFCSRLFDHPKPVALDWGFPVTSLLVVIALQRQGVQPWWFTGDRLFARTNFLNAKGPDPRPFDCQYADISAHWASIAPVFSDRIIRMVRQDGNCMPYDEVYRELVQTGDVTA
jgi:hypothetical protein